VNEAKKKDQENDYVGSRDCCGFKGFTNGGSSDDSKKYACMSACRWFPLIPLLLGVVAITAGYALNPSTIRIIWLAFSMTMAGFGLFALVIMRTMTGKPGKISCC